MESRERSDAAPDGGAHAPADAYRRIGATLREARGLLGLTQLRMGEEVGVSEATWSRYESGKQKITIPELLHAAAVLGLRLQDLFGGAMKVTESEPTVLLRRALTLMESRESYTADGWTAEQERAIRDRLAQIMSRSPRFADLELNDAAGDLSLDRLLEILADRLDE